MREEEDELFKTFHEERQSAKTAISREIDQEWEQRLQELTNKYVTEKKKKMKDSDRKVSLPMIKIVLFEFYSSLFSSFLYSVFYPALLFFLLFIFSSFFILHDIAFVLFYIFRVSIFFFFGRHKFCVLLNHSLSPLTLPLFQTIH